MAGSLDCDLVASNTYDTDGVKPLVVPDAEYAYIETPISSPSNWFTSDRQECNGDEEDCLNNDEVPPFSSSPLNLGISTTGSSGSSGSESEGISLTSAHSGCSSIFSRDDSPPSGANARTPDKFVKELHGLLLKAQEKHKHVDRIKYSFYSETSLMRTPEFSFSFEQGNQIVVNPTSRSSNFSAPKCLQSTTKSSLTGRSHELRKSSDVYVYGESASLGLLSEGMVSPINFENRRHLLSSHGSINKENTSYRIIKRARSCLGDETFQQDEVPPKKRTKKGGSGDFQIQNRIYAHRSASVRRADSLHACNGDEQSTPLDSTTRRIPTTPLTPRLRNTELTSTEANIPSPVPIIAPPSDHIPQLSLSSEAVAKIRIMRLLAREVSGRQADGLSPGICKQPPHWMLPKTGDVNPIDIDSQSSIEDDIRFDWEVVMGLGSKRRRSIVDWLLHVLPIRPVKVLHTPSVSPSPPSSVLSSGSSASTFESTDSTEPEPEHNLFDQLEHSPDTRFHAVWMFLRFFYLMMPHDMLQSNNEKAITPETSISHTSKTLQQDGLALVAWDVAVACLSLSVKFHRDFLKPLHPVYAHEYLKLAPHILTHEDLESAHRDVLAAFDYRLGITPQAVMDLLWLALPSLRSLLDFDKGWQKTQQDTWSCLFNFLKEPDVQRFPISVLTTVSLMDNISDCLIRQYHRESFSDYTSDEFVNFLNNDNHDIQAIWDDGQERARDDTEGVFCDIQALIGLTDTQLKDCRLWIACID